MSSVAEGGIEKETKNVESKVSKTTKPKLVSVSGESSSGESSSGESSTDESEIKEKLKDWMTKIVITPRGQLKLNEMTAAKMSIFNGSDRRVYFKFRISRSRHSDVTFNVTSGILKTGAKVEVDILFKAAKKAAPFRKSDHVSVILQWLPEYTTPDEYISTVDEPEISLFKTEIPLVAPGGVAATEESSSDDSEEGSETKSGTGADEGDEGSSEESDDDEGPKSKILKK